jgi:hypothetical protein
MSWRITPVKQGHGANVDAYSVSGANVPVNGHAGPMNAEFLGRINRSPHIMSIVLTYNLAVFLKVWVYRQIDSPILE